MTPDKPWFIRRVGPMRYGISPYAWQGWVITAVSIGALALNLGFLVLLSQKTLREIRIGSSFCKLVIR